MSKRNEILNNEIIPKWEEIEKSVQSIDVKGLSTSDRDEIAHFKKVFVFLFKTLKSVDADFIPIKILQRINSQLANIHNSLVSYLSNTNIQYIVNINNDYMDTVLYDLMPFIYVKGTQSKSLQAALDEYSKTILEHSNYFLENAKSSSLNAKELEGQITKIATNLSAMNDRFQKLEHTLFTSENNTKNKINELVSDLNVKHKETVKFYNEIFDENGLKISITQYGIDVRDIKNTVDELKSDMQKNLDELTEFHQKIFGSDNNSGLKQEIEIQQKELDSLKKQKEDEFIELRNKIENLLPSATSAGLSSAYYEMRNSFSENIKTYNKLFYFALGLWLIVVVGVTWYYAPIVTPSIDGETAKNTAQQTSITLKNHDIWSILEWIIARLPFLIPVLWFTIFVSKRRSEAQRLEQEYAHKEALAKSYESYRKQIEQLNEDEQKKLLPILLENMIEAIALNPATTLDKKGKNETPLEELVSKKDEVLDFMKKLKEFIPTDNGKSS